MKRNIWVSCKYCVFHLHFFSTLTNQLTATHAWGNSGFSSTILTQLAPRLQRLKDDRRRRERQQVNWLIDSHSKRESGKGHRRIDSARFSFVCTRSVRAVDSNVAFFHIRRGLCIWHPYHPKWPEEEELVEGRAIDGLDLSGHHFHELWNEWK